MPQLFQALVTNEVITKAVLNYWRTDASGKQSVYYTIELVNARISELHQFCDEDGRPNFRTALTYDEITVTWKDGNLTATDSWHGVS